MATMTKRLRLIYVLLLAVALPLLTACLNDDAVNGNEAQQDGKITVRLRLSQAASTAMRAVGEYDENATIEELMNVWTVVAVEASGNGGDEDVVGIWACKPSKMPDQEIDDTEKIITASFNKNQTYHFYSFANMSPAKVMELLGITATDAITNYMTTEKSVNNVTQFDVPEGAKVNYNTTKEKAVSMAGNNFNKFGSSDDNGFGSYGIPMSNVQTFTSLQDNDIKDLIVVRLLAKIELQIYNDKGSDVTIESITLTDITKNADNNLKLFPKYTSEKTPNGEDLKVGYEHGDIQPNLNGTPDVEDVEVEVNKNIEATGHTYADGINGVTKITFYVNESATPTNKPVDFSHFFLKIKLNGEEEARYALIDDKNAEGYSGKWDYIARNDYRIIPIVLDDYKLDMIPYDFPAIGVHPASIKEEDGIYTVTFHDYGHFHLLPQVTKYSSPTTVIPYGKTDGDYWTLYDGTFSSAWGSWTDATKETKYNNATADTAFYRTGNNDTEDADDAGGVPVWYKNDGSDGPQWQPNSTIGYVPFIFGYIADPEGELTTDRKVYHEFSINLHKNGSTARQMTYRLYMILDTDQMLYPKNGAAPVRHTHGH